MAATTTVSSAGGGGAGGSRTSLAKAYLELHDAMPGSAGNARLGPTCGRVTFQFNPRELTFRKSARWGTDPAREAASTGPAEFQGAEPSTLDLEMFFDAAENHGNVAATVEKLFTCCVPTDKSRGQKKPVPPLVVFHWGKITGFPSYISSVTATYTLFTPEGTPVRAVCTVSLQEIATEPGAQNPTSGALAARRTHTLVAGESLATIAHLDYGDPTMWRAIAEANGIDDPMRIPPGTALVVPAPDDLEAARGRT